MDHKRYLRRLLYCWVQDRGEYYFCLGFIAFSLTTKQTGFTVILVPRCDELSTKAIKTAYSSTAGTSYVTFDRVRVPFANTLGKVGHGMQVILSNFNHERWMITCTSLSAQRAIVEECLKYAVCLFPRVHT